MVDHAPGFNLGLGFVRSASQRHVHRRLSHKIARSLMRGKQRFDLPAQLRIAVASGVEENGSFLRRAFGRVVKDSLHLLPAFRGHKQFSVFSFWVLNLSLDSSVLSR